MNELQPHLEAAFAALRAPLPVGQIAAVEQRPSGNTTGLLTSPSVASHAFGIARRANQRRESRRRTEEGAREEIECFLSGRPLDALTVEEIDTLSQQLIFNEKGLPRTTARERYQMLTDRLDALWRESGRRARIKRRFALPSRFASVTRPGACGAPAMLDTLTAELAARLSARGVTGLTMKEAGGFVALGLCIDRRVTDHRLLEDLVARTNVRVVVLARRVYLEHGEHVAPDDPDACARRFRIPPLLSEVIDQHLAASRNEIVWNKTIHPTFDPIVTILRQFGRLVMAEPNLSDVVRAVASVVDQVNAMSLPGVVAGYLAGRVESYALGWRDWSRLVLGNSLQFEDRGPGDEADNSLSETLYGGVPAMPAVGSGVSGQENATEFLGEIRRRLEAAKADPSESNSRDKRRCLANALGEAIAEYNGKVSTAVLMLGQWLPAILYRPGKRGKFIAATTLLRYLSALGPRFVGVGYDVDLLAADEDEVTDFYGSLLLDADVEDSLMVAGRLGDFHRWASRHGVSDPSWDEMPPTMRGRRAATGFIAEADYQAALLLLNSDTTVDHEERVARCGLLIHCYRYGLRETEALGLLRDDMRHSASGIDVALVQNNALRKLKTLRSRRQVPLLFTLSSIECEVLKRLHLIIEAESGDRQKIPFMATHFKDRARMSRLIEAVRYALKLATGNPRALLHHARHTPPNRIAAKLIGLAAPGIQGGCLREEKDVNCNDMGPILLGASRTTRRTSWALARYLGHAGSSTLFKSYFHLFDLWHEELLPVDDAELRAPLNCAFVLDDLPKVAILDVSLLPSITSSPEATTAERIVKFMRLLARKHSAADVVAATGLALETADSLERTIRLMGKKMYLSSTTTRGGKSTGDELDFLRRISEEGWERLIKLAVEMDVNGQSGGLQEARRSNAVSADELVQIVGSTRQLVMWQEHHFSAVCGFIKRIGLPREAYGIAATRKCEWGQRVTMSAANYGFIRDENELAEAVALGQLKQIDTACDMITDDPVSRRCSVLLHEARGGVLRNRYELTVLFAADCLAESTGPG